MTPIPCTNPATVADLKCGQWAALWADSDALVRILHTSPTPRDGVRVEWDHGPGSRATVRVMPGSNPVQIRWS